MVDVAVPVDEDVRVAVEEGVDLLEDDEERELTLVRNAELDNVTFTVRLPVGDEERDPELETLSVEVADKVGIRALREREPEADAVFEDVAVLVAVTVGVDVLVCLGDREIEALDVDDKQLEEVRVTLVVTELVKLGLLDEDRERVAVADFEGIADSDADFVCKTLLLLAADLVMVLDELEDLEIVGDEVEEGDSKEEKLKEADGEFVSEGVKVPDSVTEVVTVAEGKRELLALDEHDPEPVKEALFDADLENDGDAEEEAD